MNDAARLRERDLALRTERMLAWFAILGGVVGILLTVTDSVPHPDLEKWVEVGSLGAMSVAGLAELRWLRRVPDLRDLRRVQVAAFVLQALVLLAQPALHAFVLLEAPSPALVVPVLGAVRFGYRVLPAAVGGVAVAFALRALIATEVYDGAIGIDPAVVSLVLAGTVGGVTAHLHETARRGREEVEAARARSDALHRILAEGVGASLAEVGERLVHTLADVLGAAGVRIVVEPDGDETDRPRIAFTTGTLPAEIDRYPVRHGPHDIGELHLAAPSRLLDAVPEVVDQLGVVLDAARVLDAEATLTARLRALDRMRSDFVALTSHELRTPLATIVGASETLQVRGVDLDDDEQQRMVDMLVRNADRLAGLVDDLLLVGTAQAGEVAFTPRTVRLRDVVEAAAATMHADVELEGDPDVCAWVDPDRAVQVLLNLLGNALDHGVAPVAARWRTDGAAARVEVVDRGSGIAPGQQERVFERFVKLGAMAHHSRGAGLGLAISRELARAMGGDLRLDPAAPTTTFVLTLPAAAPEPDRSAEPAESAESAARGR